jgi:Ca-activated chloride channel family protein
MMKQICTPVFLALMCLSGVAQESVAPKVAIPLIASDSHHRPAVVTVESLVITDQKTLVSGASLVRGVDLPVELGVLIDASSSERSADLNDILNAAKQFVDESIRGPEDRVFFLKFDAAPRATEWLKREQLRGAIVPVSIGGGTALYDALAMACKERMGPRQWQKPMRRILVLISDGEDNKSHITRDEAALEALRAGAVIFAIDTELSGMSYRGVKIMQNLAEVTGGESFSQVSGKDGQKVFASIKGMMDGMYYLRYVPPDASKNTVHEVEVKRAPKEKFKLSYARKYLWNQ